MVEMPAAWEADYMRDLAEQRTSGPHVFTEEQRRKNLELMRLVADLLPIDDDQKTTDCDLLYRFLIGRHWEVKGAEANVRHYVKLRAEERLNGIMAEDIAEAVRPAMSPIYGVDRGGLPVLWLAPDPKALIPILKAYPKEELLRAQMHVMESARFVSRMRGVDRCTYVLDLGKITVSSVNTLTLGFLRELIKMLQTFYPEIMRRLLVFNTGWAIMGAWKVLKPFIDQRVQDKIRFDNRSPDLRTLSEFITADNILTEYGGSGAGSVLDGPIQAEIARLRAAKAVAQAAPVTPAAPPPDARDDLVVPPSPLGPAAVQDAVYRPGRLHRESPRSAMAPEELPVIDESPTELFSVYNSVTPVAQTPLGGARASAGAAGIDSDDEGAHTDPHRNDSEGDRMEASTRSSLQRVIVGARSMIPLLSGFFGVEANYLDESTGDGLGGREPAVEGEASSLDSGGEDIASSASRSFHAEHDAEAAVDPPPPPTPIPRPDAGQTGAGRCGWAPEVPPRAGRPPAGAARAHVDPASSGGPASLPPSPPTVSASPAQAGAAAACVELSLEHSAGGAVCGYWGHECVGELRGATVYGNPLRSLRLASPSGARPVVLPAGLVGAAGAAGAAAAHPVRGGDSDSEVYPALPAALQQRRTHSPVPGSVASLVPSRSHSARTRGAEGSTDVSPGSSASAAALPSAPPRPLLTTDEAGGPSRWCVVGELLREAGHPIHYYLIVCDGERRARFVMRRSRLRSQVSLYQIVGDATVVTDEKGRHTIAGQKVRFGVATPHSSVNRRQDPGAWMLHGEDVTRPRRRIASALWTLGRSIRGEAAPSEGSTGLSGGGESASLLAECYGQTVKFHGVLARSHPVDLFTLAVAVCQLWVETDPSPGRSGLGAGYELGFHDSRTPSDGPPLPGRVVGDRSRTGSGSRGKVPRAVPTYAREGDETAASANVLGASTSGNRMGALLGGLMREITSRRSSRTASAAGPG